MRFSVKARVRALMLVATVGVATGCTVAANAATVESQPLSAKQTVTFLPLACKSPHKGKDKEIHCARLIGYTGNADPDSTLGLDAILLGSFTSSGADEAYVTYSSSNEPHATNFGGGILFRRAETGWKLVGWFPGGQMDQCVSLPGSGRLRLLCLGGYTGQGITTTAVSVQAVPVPHGSPAPDVQRTFVLQAEDRRGFSTETESGCASGVPSGKAWLLSINSISRSDAPGAFAKSNVNYETAADINRACNGPHKSKVHETRGVVQYRDAGGTVKAETPVPFVKPEE